MTSILAALAAAALLCWPGQDATFSSRAIAVRVDVLATEGHRPVGGLTASDFELLDNGVPQTIDVVDIRDLKVNAVLALDVSASTGGRVLDDLVGAGNALLAGLHDDEPASLTTFSHIVAPRVPLTTDREAVRRVFRTASAGGQTAVIDGIYEAMMTAQSEAGRPLVMVFTDGLDTASWLRPQELLDATRRASAVVYTVAAGRAGQWPLLKDIADATGGRAIVLKSSKDLESEIANILGEFRSRYVLSFSPRGVSDTGYHTLTVRSKLRNVHITARPGYSAGAKQ